MTSTTNRSDCQITQIRARNETFPYISEPRKRTTSHQLYESVKP